MMLVSKELYPYIDEIWKNPEQYQLSKTLLYFWCNPQINASCLFIILNLINLTSIVQTRLWIYYRRSSKDFLGRGGRYPTLNVGIRVFSPRVAERKNQCATSIPHRMQLVHKSVKQKLAGREGWNALAKLQYHDWHCARGFNPWNRLIIRTQWKINIP